MLQNITKQENRLPEGLIEKLETGEADIRNVDLSSLTIKPVVQQAIESLRSNSVKELDLSSKDLNLSDMVALSQALASNRSLFALNLAGNNFASNSCTALGRALQHNYTLRKLDLRNCKRVGTLSITNFLIGAQNNKDLRELFLGSDYASCSSRCVIDLMNKMPNLSTLHTNIFGHEMGSYAAHNSRDTVCGAVENGLFAALRSHYALMNFTLGNSAFLGEDDVIYKTVATRNRGFVDNLYSWRPEILDIGFHSKGITSDTLKAAFDLPLRAQKVDDFILFYKFPIETLRYELLKKEGMDISAVNVLLHSIKTLSLCVYSRDVECKDTPAEEKYQKFARIMSLHVREKSTSPIVGNKTKLEAAAEAYFRNGVESELAQIDSAIENAKTTIQRYREERFQRAEAERAARAEAERAARAEGGYDEYDIAF